MSPLTQVPLQCVKGVGEPDGWINDQAKSLNYRATQLVRAPIVYLLASLSLSNEGRTSLNRVMSYCCT